MSNLLLKYRATNSSKLERWLGADVVDNLSMTNKGWYGKPIAVAGVPGAVYAAGDGDFCGIIKAGQLSSAIDYFSGRAARVVRNFAHRQLSSANAGFTSLSDLINEATVNAKKQDLVFYKAGGTGVATATSTLWYSVGQPTIGGNAAAAPGGTVPTSASTGAIGFTNPTGGDTTHFVGAQPLGTVAQTLLLYDRLFSVTKTMNSSATEAVTGVPTRYTNTTAGTVDSAESNALIIECRTVLAATGHNWTVCTYTDQSGNTGATLPSVTGNSGCIVGRLDQPLGQWFNPLASGDTGIKNLTQMQCSALVATGAIDFTIARPLAYFPLTTGNMTCPVDGINTAFNLVRIFDSACLALLEITRPVTTAAAYAGHITVVAG